MLKKLIPLSLSLVICLSMLPSQAGAMEALENSQPIQAENVGENIGSGIAPCMAHGPDIWAPGEGPGSHVGGIGGTDGGDAGGSAGIGDFGPGGRP